MSDIRVLSFNIRNSCDKGNRAWDERIINFVPLVKSVYPDLMGFQEVLHNQYLDLTEQFPEYSSVGIGRDDGINAGERAAIFYKKSRFTLIESGSFWLSETSDKPSFGWDAVCIRICTYVKLLDSTTKKDFFYFNTHLDHVGQTAMAEGAKLIRKNMLDKNFPAFVTGDFNVEEKSEPYNIMTEKGLSDAKYTAKSTMSYGTFNNYNPSENMKDESPIDYLFHTDNDFDVDTYKVIVNGQEGTYTSDHYPVLVVLSQK